MTRSEIINLIDDGIRNELLLGEVRNKHVLQAYRNIKSDFSYIASNNSDLSAIDIIEKLRKEREENAKIYLEKDRHELWLQEDTEEKILKSWLPKPPTKDEIFEFLNTLEIPKQKSSFRDFQEKCVEHFGQKIDSKFILEFIG